MRNLANIPHIYLLIMSKSSQNRQANGQTDRHTDRPVLFDTCKGDGFISVQLGHPKVTRHRVRSSEVRVQTGKTIWMTGNHSNGRTVVSMATCYCWRAQERLTV